ncbi:hypothetical protein [Moraxella lacunata]
MSKGERKPFHGSTSSPRTVFLVAYFLSQNPKIKCRATIFPAFF